MEVNAAGFFVQSAAGGVGSFIVTIKDSHAGHGPIQASQRVLETGSGVN